MKNSLYQRWATLVAALNAEATDLSDPPDVMIRRIHALIQSCPFESIEAQLWMLHDRIACAADHAPVELR
jgi:hypothetical protein